MIRRLGDTVITIIMYHLYRHRLSLPADMSKKKITTVLPPPDDSGCATGKNLHRRTPG
jgi:hypothetical protein